MMKRGIKPDQFSEEKTRIQNVWDNNNQAAIWAITSLFF
jgi:hypothetical protein